MPKPIDMKRIGLDLVKGARTSAGSHPVKHLSAHQGFLYIPIDMLRPNPDQPRKYFDDGSLEDLAASVKEKGVLQPVLVRKDESGAGFVLIAGERRWRAAKAAGLREIPALMRAAEDELEVALIENVQRQNLNPIEEAEALLRLKQARSFTDEQLAKIIGKSRASVTKVLLLTRLPEGIKRDARASDRWTKSQLSELTAITDTQKLEALWRSMSSGSGVTVRAIRAHTAAPSAGRPRRYRFLHNPRHRPYQVLVTFTKAKVSPREVGDALKDALKHLP